MAKKEMKIIKKRSGRYAVRGVDGAYINGDEKVKVLVEKGLIKAAVPAKKEEPAEEAPAE